MEIREAVPTDLDALMLLEEECEGPDAWSRNLLAAGLAGTVPTVRYIVAEGEEGLLGYAIVSCVDDIAELQRIGVDPASRRSGIGSHLLSEVFTVARRAGAQRMLLEVRATNAPAIAMYAAHGFIEIDRRQRYYRDGGTAIVMRLPVAKGCGW